MNNLYLHEKSTKSRPPAFNFRHTDLLIEPTTRTPFVKYCSYQGLLMIAGSSIEVDMHRFYQPVISHLKQVIDQLGVLKIHLCLNDLNTSTVKVLFDLFHYLKGQQESGKVIEVVWEAPTPEIMETGMDLAEFININLNVVSLVAA